MSQMSSKHFLMSPGMQKEEEISKQKSKLGCTPNRCSPLKNKTQFVVPPKLQTTHQVFFLLLLLGKMTMVVVMMTMETHAIPSKPKFHFFLFLDCNLFSPLTMQLLTSIGFLPYTQTHSHIHPQPPNYSLTELAFPNPLPSSSLQQQYTSQPDATQKTTTTTKIAKENSKPMITFGSHSLHTHMLRTRALLHSQHSFLPCFLPSFVLFFFLLESSPPAPSLGANSLCTGYRCLCAPPPCLSGGNARLKN